MFLHVSVILFTGGGLQAGRTPLDQAGRTPPGPGREPPPRPGREPPQTRQGAPPGPGRQGEPPQTRQGDPSGPGRPPQTRQGDPRTRQTPPRPGRENPPEQIPPPPSGKQTSAYGQRAAGTHPNWNAFLFNYEILYLPLLWFILKHSWRHIDISVCIFYKNKTFKQIWLSLLMFAFGLQEIDDVIVRETPDSWRHYITHLAT